MDHQAYDVAADSFEVTCDRPLDISIQQWFDHANRGTWKIRDPKQLEQKLRSILATAQQRWSWWPIRGVRLWLLSGYITSLRDPRPSAASNMT